MKPKIIGAPEYIAVDEDWRQIDAPLKSAAMPGEFAFKLRAKVPTEDRRGDVYLILGDVADGDKFEDRKDCVYVAAGWVSPDDLAYRPVRWRR